MRALPAGRGVRPQIGDMALGEVIAQQAPMFPPLCPPLFPPYDVGPVAVVVLDAKLSNIADKHGITVVDAV